METLLVNCRCYVLKLPLEDALTLHWGAHEQRCPVYRPSPDPVDRANDEEFRASHLDSSTKLIPRQVPTGAKLSHNGRAVREGTEG